MKPGINFAVSLVIIACFATASWLLIERRALALRPQHRASIPQATFGTPAPSNEPSVLPS
jgi:hypothetical protein